MPGISVITITAGPWPATWTRFVTSLRVMSRRAKSSSASSTFMPRAVMAVLPSGCVKNSAPLREVLQVLVAGGFCHLGQAPDSAVDAPSAVGDVVDHAGGGDAALLAGQGGGHRLMHQERIARPACIIEHAGRHIGGHHHGNCGLPRVEAAAGPMTGRNLIKHHPAQRPFEGI